MSFFNKEFYKNYLPYLFPIGCSFLFFWKLGDASFWFDELVTLKTVSETTLYQFFLKSFANHLNPPLYLILLKVYLYAIDFLNDAYNLLLMASYLNAKALDNLFLFFEIPVNKFYEFYNIYFPESIVRQLHSVSETNLRLPSAIFLTAANVLIFDFFKKNKLTLIGIVSCLLIGTNSKLIYYAQEARPYALFILIFILILREFYKNHNKDLNLSNFKRLIFFNLLLVLTHYYGVFVVCSEMLVLLVRNRKNKIFVLANIIAAVVLTFLFVLIWQLQISSDMKVFGKISFYDLKNMYLDALGYFLGWKFFVAGALAFLTKIFFKHKSNVNAFILKAGALYICVLSVILFFVSIRPVFNVRYTIFLVPLQILIITSIYYAISEAIFLFVKNHTLKKAAVATAFLMFTLILVIGQSFFHFNIFNYYEIQKYYPIKSAYIAITNDKDYKLGAHYALEEYAGENFKYYEQKYGLKQAVNLNPKISNFEKESNLSEAIKKTNDNIIYYIRVRHKETTQQEEFIGLRRFSKRLVFKEQGIEAYKFTKEF